MPKESEDTRISMTDITLSTSSFTDSILGIWLRTEDGEGAATEDFLTVPEALELRDWINQHLS